MPHTLFISDLHLSVEHPRSAQLFLQFAQHTAPQAEALYILGDLFDAWAGDDDMDDPFHRSIVDALRSLTDAGTRVYLMHGNRDFLMDQRLCQACGATLLSDPVLIDLYGNPALLTHGDQLCTDDTAYQAVRKQVRTPEWQRQFLSQTLSARKAAIAQFRTQSREATRNKASDIMDVNGAAVAAFLRQHNYPELIHGHTHRMGHHVLHVDGHTCQRWVLGDWDTRANALRCDANGMRWENIPA
jgi:UDP-2,3-diacylglucosamine hydrolase